MAEEVVRATAESTRTPRRHWTLAAVLAVVTFAGYMIGSGRAFGYDAAVTMENFVSGPPSWAFTRQVVWNNHPLFSFLAGLLADVAGTGEAVMRALPAFFGAAAVGLATWRFAARWGRLAGIAGGLVLATHPLLVEASREVRGYSLAVLAIVVMGIAVLELDEPALFAAAGVVGIGSHMYAAVPFAALLAYLLAARRVTSSWRSATLATAVGVGAVYAGTLASSGRGGDVRLFRPTFPVDAMWSLLGGSLVPVAALAVVLLLAGRAVRWTRPAIAGGAVAAVGVLVPWLLAPYDLYPRFIYFLVPALGLVCAVAVHHHPQAFALVALACIGCLSPELDHWVDDELPNRDLASQMGPGTCLSSLWSSEAVEWYAPPPRDECSSIAVLRASVGQDEIQRLRSDWPVVCWRVEDRAFLLAKRAADCPGPEDSPSS